VAVAPPPERRTNHKKNNNNKFFKLFTDFEYLGTAVTFFMSKCKTNTHVTKYNKVTALRMADPGGRAV
jgi:hypothetical protein